MPASIVQAVKQLIAVKNAYAANASATAGQYSFLLNDSRRSLWEFVEAALEADEEIVTAIDETVGHWARPDYLAESDEIAHGSEIPTHVGEVGKVLIQRAAGEDFLPARGKRSAAEIERYRANTGTYPNDVYGKTVHTAAGSPLAGYYDISEEDVLFYTGLSAKVRLANYVRSLRVTLDAVTAGGTKGLESPLGGFSSADNGSLAVVAGAGVGGVDFASEILSGAGTSAILADVVPATVSAATLWVARLQSPAAYLPLVVRLALPKLYKEGDSEGLQSSHIAQAADVIPMVRRNARIVPDVVMGEKAA
jgi:hypothetical protein